MWSSDQAQMNPTAPFRVVERFPTHPGTGALLHVRCTFTSVLRNSTGGTMSIQNATVTIPLVH
jgi:hypothetical protein